MDIETASRYLTAQDSILKTLSRSILLSPDEDPSPVNHGAGSTFKSMHDAGRHLIWQCP